jgi:translation initiation factor 2B subunit (eIF-2B alpha/beta/delta family)
MDEVIAAEIAAIGADTRSGATALLIRALEVLRRAASDPADLDSAARELCRVQPAMAGLRTAATIARGPDAAAALGRFRIQVARASHAIARHAVGVLTLRRAEGACRIVTCSASAAVQAVVVALAERIDVALACAEGRPRLEGLDLAARLAQRGIPVEVYTDAGIGTALDRADALLVGADAVGPSAFINKVGTHALCALASSMGTPAYVLAGREKILSAEHFAELTLNVGPPGEVWDLPPKGVAVGNPYFERIPLSLVQMIITDGGVRHI